MTLQQFAAAFADDCARVGIRGVDGAELMRRILGVGPATQHRSAGTTDAGAPVEPPSPALRARPLMLEAVASLREAGFKTGIITNNFVGDGSDQLIDAAFSPFMDVIVQSCRVGMRKPDPRIFNLAACKLNVPPRRIVYLDDIGTNLKAAAMVGMATIKVGAADADGAEAVRALEARLGLRLVRSVGALLRKARL